MFEDITKSDIEVLNGFSNLNPSGQREFRDYMRYLLCKQYKRELMGAIFHNGLLHSLLQSMLNITERDEFPINQIENRIKQIRELYFGIFDKIHSKYSVLIDGLDGHELVKDFGRINCENVDRACRSGNRLVIRMEVVEFYEGYYKFAQKKENRIIAAV